MSVLVIAFLCRFISSETTLKCWARFHRLISENSKTSEILEPSHFRLHNKWRVNFCFNHLSNPFFSCLQFPQRFSCYHHYCWEEENSLEFARRQMESNPHFLIFIQVNILVAINTHTHTHTHSGGWRQQHQTHHGASTVHCFDHRCFSSDVTSLHLPAWVGGDILAQFT